jgi:hypothetical protein
MECADILRFIDARRICEPSPYGLKIVTQCLYPSAAPVFVHVGAWGDEYRVTDGGEAAEHALHLGRDKWAVEAGLRAARDRYSLRQEQAELFAMAPDQSWLPNVVAAVANGAAFAASVSADHDLHRQQKSLNEQISERLHKTVPEKYIAKGYEYRGRSGKLWELDFAVTSPIPILIKAVTPHHNSIASTYTALSDILREDNRRFSVYNRRPHDDDAALLRQVAELVPVKGLAPMLVGLELGLTRH